MHLVQLMVSVELHVKDSRATCESQHRGQRKILAIMRNVHIMKQYLYVLHLQNYMQNTAVDLYALPLLSPDKITKTTVIIS